MTCFFLELPKCSQNRAVAHPYSMNSIILFLFCLESLVKMGFAQKKRWARSYKAFRSDLSSTVWWLSGPHMTSIWWLNPVSGVTSENSLVLVVPFFAGCVMTGSKTPQRLPASIPAPPAPAAFRASFPPHVAGTRAVWGVNSHFLCWYPWMHSPFHEGCVYFRRMEWQRLERGSLLGGVTHPSLPGI